MISIARVASALVLCGLVCPGIAGGQEAPALQAELRRIFESGEYATESFGPARWLDGGDAYTTVEPSGAEEGARDIVRYETASGRRDILVSAARLVPEGRDEALRIEDYAWSGDRERLLIFANSRRVWRRNTRGDYWVLDLATDRLRQLGGDGPASTLMFAKFSPEADRVAYVRAHDLYVEEIATGTITTLTRDGSPTIINGTLDWVYEEELGVRDGFRWSPDGARIAFWNFDSAGVGEFTLINNTDALYPATSVVPYPKAGTTNSAVRIGVVDATGGDARWMDVPGDPRNHYIARMDWIDAETLVLQHLNRLQNVNDVLLADAGTGNVGRVHRDESDAWVEVVNTLDWIEEDAAFLWTSERDGWRHVYRVARADGASRLITQFDGDVVRVLGARSRRDLALRRRVTARRHAALPVSRGDRRWSSRAHHVVRSARHAQLRPVARSPLGVSHVLADGAAAGTVSPSGQAATRRGPMGRPIVHVEIGCEDRDRTGAFYTKLFDWRTEPYGPFSLKIDTGSEQGVPGHITALGHEPHRYVMFYVEVGDIAAHLAEAERLRGQTIIPETDVPGGGRFAWVKDPGGRMFGLLKKAWRHLC